MFRDSNRTLGGGLAAMELLRQAGIARGWLDESDNALLVAASRLTPGTNVLAYCVGFGWKLRRSAGALTSLAAASLPGAVAITVISATLVRIDDYRIVRAVLAAGTLVAAALVLWTTWALLRPHLRSGGRRRTAIVAAVAVGLLLIGATPVQTLLAAACVGAAVQR
jgi:chromate transporter